MVDWLENTNDSTTRTALTKAGFAKEHCVRDHVKVHSSALTFCCEITNGYKHWELDGYWRTHSQIDEALLSAPSSRPISATPSCLPAVPKVKTNSGTRIPVLQVYKDAAAYWESFFKSLGL
jgi:hypothetical protein